MHSWTAVLVHLLLVGSLFWKETSGYPFKLLPRVGERLADQRNMDKQIMLQENSLLSTDYQPRPVDSPGPVDPWIKITQHPVKGLEVDAGTRVTLECKVSGSPPPEVLWFTGAGPTEELLEYVRASTLDLYEGGMEWKGIARVTSKLSIECASPEDAGLIYCAAVSSRKILVSKPTALIVNGDGRANCSKEAQPMITLYSPTRVANIGSTVILPCRASGKPQPEVSWVDNYNVPVSLSNNPRQRQLINGDLLIERLEWEDMGGYTCKASSGHNEEAVDTFLYPLRPENQQDRTVN